MTVDAGGRGAVRAGEPGHQAGRGRRRRRQRRQAHHLDHHRRARRRRRSSSASRSNQDRALNDVKDAIAKIRADLPRTIDEPIVAAHRDRGPADRDLRGRARRRMTPEELSWFVDDVVARAAAGREGRRPQSSASAASTARSASTLDPDRLLALRHHRRRRQPAAARDQRRPRRRPRRGRRAASRRSARWPAPQRSRPRRDQRSCCPAGRKVRLDELGDGDGRRRRAAHLRALQRRAGRRLRDLARQGRERRRRSAPASPRRSSELRQAHPDVALRR